LICVAARHQVAVTGDSATVGFSQRHSRQVHRVVQKRT